MMFIPHEIFDRKYWSGFDGCIFLIIYNDDFSKETIDSLWKEILKHNRKTRKSAYEYLAAVVYERGSDVKWLKENFALCEFIKICRIYITYYDLDDPITPKEFIVWAKDRESFSTPHAMLEWYEKKKEKTPIKKMKRLEMRIEELENQLTDFQNKLFYKDEKIAKLEEKIMLTTKHDIGSREIRPESWRNEYPVCAFVADKHEEGKTRMEIIQLLQDKGLTVLQCGGLTKDDLSFQSDGALKKEIQRLKNKR